jgi:BirA family biotin operon repressor/biotin-[acetyl-CoA-carboxylase] ligase
MSLALRTETEITQTVRITSAAAVAGCRAIRTVCGLHCEIKWVNDIYKNGNKLCGILTEAINDYTRGITEYLILGIGVNLTEHPTEINATDLLAETGQAVDRHRLCAEITKELLAILDQIIGGDSASGASAYMDEYRRLSCVIGRKIKLIQQDTETIGSAVGIDDEGGLIVTFPDGRTETLTSGEISLRFLN